MAGEAKYAHRLANHLETPIDAACMIDRPGNGAVSSTGWLAVGPDVFALVTGDAWMGHPRGRPIAVVPYTDVTGIDVTLGRTTVRADVELCDRRTVGFEVRHIEADTPDLEVLKLLVRRCERTKADGSAMARWLPAAEPDPRSGGASTCALSSP